MPERGTRSSPEVLFPLDRSGPRSLRVQLTARLREVIRSGALPRGQRVPSSRALASDLAVSRRLVVEVYDQLVAEGYLRSTPRSGTVVGDIVPFTARGTDRRPIRPLRYDLRPGIPDLTAFPVAAWRRATNRALARPAAELLAYPESAGWWPLRVELAGYLHRVRGVDAHPDRVLVCSSAANALFLVTSVLSDPHGCTVAVEQPGMHGRAEIITRAGGRWVPLEVDEDGVQTSRLGDDLGALLVSPAHQFPTGAALSHARRAELTRWAAGGKIVVEDDYDAEFRYDRAPIGALQGLAPDQVAYVGTVSKSLAPGLRLGWMVLPDRLVDPARRAKLHTDGGTSALLQASFTEFLASGDYDRHLRAMRHRYRRRRDAVIAALARELPGTRVVGAAAGLHLTVPLPRPVDRALLRETLRSRGVESRCVDDYRAGPAVSTTSSLVLGYGNLDSRLVDEAVGGLAAGLASLHLDATP